MDIRLAPTRIFVLKPVLDLEAARQQAVDKRLGVVAGGIGALLARPKPEEVDLVYVETRYEPVWHVVCTVRFAFERHREFSVPVTGVEVRSVTLFGQEFAVAAQPQTQPGILQQIGLGGALRTFSVPGVEHCVDESRQERILDAVTGQPAPLTADFLAREKVEVSDLEALLNEEALVVPPQTTAAPIVKPLLAAMIKPIQADRVTEEVARIDTLDLYFRPLYAFEFAWKPKNKTGVAEFDAITGAMTTGKAVHARSERPLSRETLFDINASTVTTLMPSATISARLVVE
jgi:hypothetical protein